MSDWQSEPSGRRDGVTIPTIWIAVALSLLLHVAVLWQWLPRMLLNPGDPNLTEIRDSLVVRLAPAPTPPRASNPAMPRVRSAPASTATVPQAAPRTPPAAPVIALNRPAPDAPRAPAPAVETAPAPARPPGGDDLSSFIEARRRARADSAPAAPPGSASSAPPAEDEKARANRIAAANLGTDRTPTFGPNPTGGGVFQIVRVGYENAEFLFFGWNHDIRRNTTQRIEVRKGANSDIQQAVVRKMVAIIRENVQEDFLWESQRLGRTISLSARARDNLGLEDFLMREFFADRRVAQ